MKLFSAILLAGGKGSRFQSETPKQFLPLNNIPVALHSFSLIANHLSCEQVVVVCEEKWRRIFDCPPPLSFASPGDRRQDSVYNGLLTLPDSTSTVLIHDLARPLLSKTSLELVLEKGWETGNCCLAKKVQNTIRRAKNDVAIETLERDSLYEVETPQVIHYPVLKKGFAISQEKKCTVTDDCSLAELAGYATNLVLHNAANPKITYPEDLLLISRLFFCILFSLATVTA